MSENNVEEIYGLIAEKYYLVRTGCVVVYSIHAALFKPIESFSKETIDLKTRNSTNWDKPQMAVNKVHRGRKHLSINGLRWRSES